MHPPRMTTEAINTFLDQMKHDLGFRSDVQLGRYLNVSGVTLWRWRQGQLDETKQLIIAYLQARIAAAACTTRRKTHA